ncbi:hypothetical protein [Kosmotoga arenicorallina]|nr:hypothetical protein [Kosmotoga arenicorallina]
MRRRLQRLTADGATVDNTTTVGATIGDTTIDGTRVANADK